MLFRLFEAFIANPALALIPVALFALAWLASRSRATLVMAGLWLIYALLEFGNKARITCSGECNIRVDLLVIASGLALGSVLALFFIGRRLVARSRA